MAIARSKRGRTTVTVSETEITAGLAHDHIVAALSRGAPKTAGAIASAVGIVGRRKAETEYESLLDSVSGRSPYHAAISTVRRAHDLLDRRLRLMVEAVVLQEVYPNSRRGRGDVRYRLATDEDRARVAAAERRERRMEDVLDALRAAGVDAGVARYDDDVVEIDIASAERFVALAEAEARARREETEPVEIRCLVDAHSVLADFLCSAVRAMAENPAADAAILRMVDDKVADYSDEEVRRAIDADLVGLGRAAVERLRAHVFGTVAEPAPERPLDAVFVSSEDEAEIVAAIPRAALSADELRVLSFVVDSADDRGRVDFDDPCIDFVVGLPSGVHIPDRLRSLVDKRVLADYHNGEAVLTNGIVDASAAGLTTDAVVSVVCGAAVELKPCCRACGSFDVASNGETAPDWKCMACGAYVEMGDETAAGAVR